MQTFQILFAWAACGTLAALLLLCLAGRLKAHPPSPRAMRGVPTAALVALLALAAAVGSRAVPKSRAPAPGGRASPRAAMPGAGSAATPRVAALSEAASLVTEGINTSNRFRYEQLMGRSVYTYENELTGVQTLLLTHCIERLNGSSRRYGFANCTDCASFVTAFSNVSLDGYYKCHAVPSSKRRRRLR